MNFKKIADTSFKFTVRSLCFMYSVGVCWTYLHVARIIADYLFRYSEAEAFRYINYINRLLLKVFLLLVIKKCVFYLQLLLFLRKATGFHSVSSCFKEMQSHLKSLKCSLKAPLKSPAGLSCSFCSFFQPAMLF